MGEDNLVMSGYDDGQNGHNQSGSDDVTVTNSTFARVSEIIKDEQPGTALRVAVAGGGCSGFRYTFELTTTKLNDDLEFKKNDARLLIDAVSLDLLRGSTIDYVDDIMGRAFKINNPNATASCGCGTSFSV